MSQLRLRQASTYLHPAEYANLATRARQRGISVSAYLKLLVEDDRPATQSGDITATLNRLLIAVDALVKHHPNEQLFKIVRATQQAKVGGRSDEA